MNECDAGEFLIVDEEPNIDVAIIKWVPKPQ
jgi:hypothetical protein